MAKSKISETKKLTHKLATEGTLSVNGDNTITIKILEDGDKSLHELVKNFSGAYVKITVTEEDTEEVETD